MGMFIFKLVVGVFACWVVCDWLQEAWDAHRSIGRGMLPLTGRRVIIQRVVKATLLMALYGVSLWYGQPYGWIAASFEWTIVDFLFWTVFGGIMEWLMTGGPKEFAVAFGQLATWLWNFWYIQAGSYIGATLFVVWGYQKAKKHQQDVADLKAKNKRLHYELDGATDNYRRQLASYWNLLAGLEAVNRRMQGSKENRPSRAVELLRIDVGELLKKHPFDNYSKGLEGSCNLWGDTFKVQEEMFLRSRTTTH